MSRDGTADLPDPVGKLQRYVRRANTPMPERMTQFHVVDPRRLETVFEPDALAAIDADEPLAIWRERYRSAASDDRLQAMQHLDMQTALADNDLRKVGRACDLAGVGVAFPFLDEEVAAFAARLPPEWLIRRFELRAFYRDATKGFLPDDVRTKKKQGFGMPFPIWARGDPELAETFDACLAGLRQRGLFRADFLETVRANHRRAEPTPHDQIIYDLVMLELWYWERGL
jgi:asparagine synthase (glutamine-hydrolysing)